MSTYSSECILFDDAAGSYLDDPLLQRFVTLRREFPWNPHGITVFSEYSRREILRSENRLLAALNIPESECRVIWTGTGTEALNLGIGGYAAHAHPAKIFCDPMGHPAMLESARQAAAENHIRFCPMDASPEGQLSISEAYPSTALSCVCLINNETGVIQPPGFLSNLPGTLCLDITQAIGKIPFDWQKEYSKAQIIGFSGRKLGIPVNMGAVIISKKIRISPRQFGGNQQNGLRPGTLDAASCSILASAVESAIKKQQDSWKAAEKGNRLFREMLKKSTDGKIIFFSPPDSSPFICSCGIPDKEGALVARLLAQNYGILIGTGSACSAESTSTSHVLKAMGISDQLARCAIRISFSAHTTETAVSRLASAIKEILPLC